MRWQILLCVVATTVSCAPAEKQPEPDQPADAASDRMADLAGTWTVTGLAQSSDSVLITYDLTATATSEGWTSTLPGREPIPVRVVQVDGDSVVAEAGPFESVLRPGVMVTTRTIAHVQGDTLTGTIEAHYASGGADSVMTGRLRGIRKTP